MSDIMKRIEELSIVPVVALDRVEDAKPLADALVAGGLPVTEITFRTAAAPEAIKASSKVAGLLVGAGTVTSVDLVKQAMDCGATFIVAPGFNPKVVSYCLANNIPVLPGVATPTDIEMAMDHGIKNVKFFPAEPLGGLPMIKALAAPYGQMRFVPTGGITSANIGEYLKFKPIIACGGSWMVAKELIAAGDFAKITALTKEAVAAAKAVRSK